jgi:cytochrome c-type biogenesis protein CcmH/NrfG
MLLEASRLDPLNMEALLLLGAAYASLNRYEEAAVYAREATRLDPEHSAARRLLADVNRKRRAVRAYGGKRRIQKRNR